MVTNTTNTAKKKPGKVAIRKKYANVKWLKTTELAEKLKVENRDTIVQAAAEKKITSKKEGGINYYPWPQVRDEWRTHRKEVQKKATKVTAGAVDIKEAEATDVISSEKLMQLLKDGEPGSDKKTYQWARAMNELIKVKQQQIKLLGMEDKTVDIEDVEKWVFETSRQNRDAWLNWPQVVSLEMAQELGVEPGLMNDILLKHIRKHLDKISRLPDSYESKAVQKP